ncbi:AAA family ATPase [Paenibacillus agilis]|uniref:AAA family ATPase n=1 Tax=Paenibacillus agilis TaxID=3020863 RepID=A0A559IZ85_9BACL|nr:AAA family ATPase [Paenibacillus agilis]TVX92930.1 AAA family ATPase [Paenibacillus agilis]
MNNRTKRWLEVGVGILIPLTAFLAYIGFNVWPVVFAVAAISLLAFVAKRRGQVMSRYEGNASRTKSGMITDKSLHFHDIGGQERAKQELIEALDFLVKREDIRKFGIRPLKGLLLTGPPGTGKTLMAKAAANYADAVFLGASGSEFVEMYVGVGAGRIRELFKEARQQAKKLKKESAVIFIDEIDVIGGKRDGGQQREYDQTLNQLLTEMDGLYGNENPQLLIIAATNRKEMLDPALLRPGRFDRHIQVDLPDKNGRTHILQLHAKNKPMADDVNLERIAEETFGFSGAQLESVLNEGAIYAMREADEQIQMKHLTQAIDKVMMGEKTDRETAQDERFRVAVHELGHAIAAEAVRPGSVSQISLSPRGQALGYVRHQPLQDRYIYTKPFLEEQIMIALGGAVAEEMFYGDRSTGSQGDFDQALNIVETMVNAGLTELGIVRLKHVSNEKLTAEMNRILEELHSKVREQLEQNRAVFDQAILPLLQDERLDGNAFRCLFCDSKKIPV